MGDSADMGRLNLAAKRNRPKQSPRGAAAPAVHSFATKKGLAARVMNNPKRRAPERTGRSIAARVAGAVTGVFSEGLGTLASAPVGLPRGINQHGSVRAPKVGPTARRAGEFIAEQSGVASANRLRQGKGGALDVLALAGVIPAGRLGRLAAAAGGRAAPVERLLKMATSEKRVILSNDQAVAPHIQAIAKDARPGQKFRHGRLYKTDNAIERNRMNYSEELPRIAMITDPATGVSFTAPTKGYHHIHVEEAARRLGYENRAPWLQHEMWDYIPPSAAEPQGFPARMGWAIYTPQGGFGEAWAAAGVGANHALRRALSQFSGAPTRASEFAQMRLLRDLQRRGLRPYVPGD